MCRDRAGDPRVDEQFLAVVLVAAKHNPSPQLYVWGLLRGEAGEQRTD